MLEVSSDLIERTIAILGTDGISQNEIEAGVLELTKDPMLARRLIDWLPEAFGLVLAPHIADLQLPRTFQAKSLRGEWLEFEFNAEPIFARAVAIGMQMLHQEPNKVFGKIASRSSSINAINRALEQGEVLKGGVLSGPALAGIPAEIYLAAPGQP